MPNSQESPDLSLPELPRRRRSSFREPTRGPAQLTTDAPSGSPDPDAAADPQSDSAAAADPQSDSAAAAHPQPDSDAAAHPQPDDGLHLDGLQPDDPQPARPTSGKPRHRAERVRNRRTAGSAFRRTVALSCASAILGVSALGAVAASADSGRSSTTATSRAGASSVAAADTLAASVAEAEADTGPTVTSELSVAAAPFTGGTQVSVAGEHLDEVASITVGGTPAVIVAAGEAQLTFAVPAVDQSALGTAADVRFADAAGLQIEAEAPTAVVAAGTSVVQPLAGELTGITEPTAPTAPRSLTLTYTSDPTIDAQLAYVLTYWSDYNSGVYPVITGYDCANFASQSLLARGWTMDAGWNLDLATGAMTPSWASSTALRDYLNTRTDRATALDDSQRGLVKVGDIAQFDWDDSGDRDHTAVVTRVEHTASGSKVWVGGHTKDADFWDVDTALATGGGSVSYFSIR